MDQFMNLNVSNNKLHFTWKLGKTVTLSYPNPLNESLYEVSVERLE